MVPPVRGMLKRSQADFEYINIHQDNDGRERVRQINNGNESVPTLVFSDGSTLTEPSTKQLKETLEGLGYQVIPPTATEALRENPIRSLLGLLFLLMGFFDGNPWLIGFGLLVLLYALFKDKL